MAKGKQQNLIETLRKLCQPQVGTRNLISVAKFDIGCWWRAGWFDIGGALAWGGFDIGVPRTQISNPPHVAAGQEVASDVSRGPF